MPTARAVRPALVVALLLIAVPTAAAPAEPSPAPAAASPSMLSPGDDRTADFVTPSIDVSATLAVGHQRGAERVRRRTLTHRLDRVNDVDAKQRVLFQAGTTTKRSAAALRADERALRTSYLNGSISAATYVRSMGVNAAKAQQLRRTMGRIGSLADGVNGITVRKRILETRLIGLDGPVRTHVLAAIDGSNTGRRIHVMATPNGTALATFDDRGQYVREAYRGDHWTRNDVGTATLSSVVELVETTYPEAYNRSTSTSFTGGLGRGIYEATLRLPAGSLRAHLDSDTRQVFFEVRTGPPETLAADAAVTVESDSLRVIVNRTVPGGPLRIATVDAQTGEPVSRPIVVDGRTARTGENGVHWTLMPDRTRVSIRVATDDGPVTLTVRPIISGPTPSAGGTDDGPQLT